MSDWQLRLFASVLSAAAIALLWPNSAHQPSEPAPPGTITAAPAPAPAPQPASVAAPPAPPAPASLAEQVERPRAARTPASLFRAYQLLAECDQFNRLHDRLIVEPAGMRRTPGDSALMRTMTAGEKDSAAQLCGPMTERMRLSRLDDLSAAAQAGLAEAAIAFATEGPFGDRSALTTRPNDPLVQAWKAQATAQLRHSADDQGDIGSVHFLLAEYGGGSELSEKDPALAYRYALAMNAIMEKLFQDPGGFARVYGPDSELARTAAASLTPAQRAAEQAEAERIARIGR